MSRLTVGWGIGWTAVWLGFMLLYTGLDVCLWRKMGNYGKPLNLISMMLCIGAFFWLLRAKGVCQLKLFKNLSAGGILLAAVCAASFYLLLDRGLDPLLARAFPVSEVSYRQSLQSLAEAPVLSLLQVCLLAPLVEEILMREVLLAGFMENYGKIAALLLSALLFALLHFNMVQTLSAFVCGIGLGLLYLKTGSVFCCMLAHMGYNLISYVQEIWPLCCQQQ